MKGFCIIWMSLSIALFCSCDTSHHSTNIDKSLKKEQQTESVATKDSTIHIHFYRPNDKVLDSLMLLPSYEGLVEVDADFMYYTLLFIDSVADKTTVKVSYTSDSTITVYRRQYDRSDLGTYGALFASEDTVIVLKGIYSDETYFQTLEEIQ